MFLALDRVIMALWLIRPLNYLNEEEAKHLTTLESLVDRRREDLAGLPRRAGPRPSGTQAKPVPGGSCQGVKYLRVSQSSERSRHCPKAAPQLEGMSVRARGPPLTRCG